MKNNSDDGCCVGQRQYNAKTSNPLTSKRLSAIKACCRLLEINWIFSLKKLVVASQTNLIFSLLPIVDGCRQSYREIWKWMISFYVQVENIVRCKITVVLCFQKPNTSILHLQNPQIQFSFLCFLDISAIILHMNSSPTFLHDLLMSSITSYCARNREFHFFPSITSKRAFILKASLMERTY